MAVDESNYEVRLWLIENVYRENRDWAKMEEMCQQAINTAPLERNVHEFRAFACRKLKQWDEAVFEYTIVRKLASGTPEEALAIDVGALLDIASTWLNADDKDKCKKALEEAKTLDPKNPRIQTIEDQLKGTGEEEEGY